jgi:hypothetical protein
MPLAAAAAVARDPSPRRRSAGGHGASVMPPAAAAAVARDPVDQRNVKESINFFD